MIFFSLLCLSFISYSTASIDLVPQRRAISNPDAVVNGSEDGGWNFLPTIPDATLYPDWVVNSTLNAVIPVYQTTGLTASNVKRAVIALPGKARDCWYYWNSVNNALYLALDQYDSIKREEISILAPCFLDQNDLNAGAAKSEQLVWGITTWISGYSNVAPANITDYSAYEVLDALIDYYMDTDTYPNLQSVVLAGHSAGAQMIQRYVGLRKSTENDDRLHSWIANPGSLMWLTDERPLPNASCTGWDDYKYGLAGNFPAYSTKFARKEGRDGIVSRYVQRYSHYAWGLLDDGAGDTRCQAETQGVSHLERGRNFIYMLGNMTGSLPNHTTVDWVANASHDNIEMMQSGEGLEKLFVLDYNGSTTDYGSTSDDDDGGSSSSSGKKKKNAAVTFSPLRSAPALIVLASIYLIL